MEPAAAVAADQPGPSSLACSGNGQWRDLIPKLAETHHVLALDLPGHGFTASPPRAFSGLNEMAGAIADLMLSEGWEPNRIIGHSAGAAIALRLSQILPVDRIVGINPALDNFQGVAGWLFPLLARALAMNPLTAKLFTMGASDARARRLIQGTGSKLNEEGYRFYTRLMADKDHVNGALNMMARWSLDDLMASLPNTRARCLFLIGDQDLAVPPSVGVEAAKRLPYANAFEDVGHLMHEENPEAAVIAIKDFIGA
jgi:magnesium chelatase accessory protein